ncbi:hypothetical protein [Seleniivibrio woodruffii]|uniref:Uncharacterized protein n=1 Tax=Seleniivibrio woodruffii TaxID=1078050 RepID=A0A4R1K2E0_9BACT|nr:hypothetical protein [Seleniivibrio woodruffii]TCK58196.1 hypothetical protein C8D98_2711 [Seleniivibrio woodruffii]TVZ35661.1 hypothetical protein OF66_1276 [Seleniivibrio woodruffii]
MMTIAGITLPETAVWANETAYGQPMAAVETDLAGTDRVYYGSENRNLEIYIPATESGMKRDDVIALCRIAADRSAVHAEINGREFSVRFASDSSAIELKPVRAKQTQAGDDSYYGTIRLLEV